MNTKKQSMVAVLLSIISAGDIHSLPDPGDYSLDDFIAVSEAARLDAEEKIGVAGMEQCFDVAGEIIRLVEDEDVEDFE